MKIVLASDHAGYDLKKGIGEYLAGKGVVFTDLGCGPGESVDYVEFGAKAAASVVRGEHDLAILCCGTGMGMAVVANKFKGIRATPCWNAYTAEMSRRHNDANCLTMGGRVLTVEEGRAIVEAWLGTLFEGGRHATRVEKILRLEREHFK